MMHIHLAYGKDGLLLALPDDWQVTVVEPRFEAALADATGALDAALAQPYGCAALDHFVQPGERVGIIFSDITRPTPHRLILPALLRRLAHVPDDQITLFNATGTHRPNTGVELREMLGDDLVDRYRLVQNNSADPTTQVRLGVSSRGNEIWLNREVMDCDVKILTGFIEPHFFAGFSGGGKALMPGMAGLRTILGNHNAQNIGHPNATWGIIDGNPIAEEVLEVALQAGRTFLVNVTLNRAKQITAVFAGELRAAHSAGSAFVKERAMAPVEQPFDVVVTTNSGYPLDLNLYQAVKGMSAAARVVKPGGTIIIALDGWDGIPDHGPYGRLLREASSPQALLHRINTPGFLEQDQWQAQIQALVQLKAEVYVYSGRLSEEQIRSALLLPCRSIEETLQTLRERYGPGMQICVLPEGPQTIPYLNEND